MKKRILVVGLYFVILSAVPGWLKLQTFNITSAASLGQDTHTLDSIPVKGMVNMIDLGAKSCVPCKMMAPILEKVEKDYQGKAHIIFIDVWKDKATAQRFNVKAIPTQIFFDKEGNEVFRHVGFMSEEAIVNQLQNMGVR